LAFGFWKLLTERRSYQGEFAKIVLMPLAIYLPFAIVAVGVGACVVWLVESERPVLWALLPSALYAYFGYSGHHYAVQPTPSDRIGQVIGALFPAIACIGGALAAIRTRTASKRLATPAQPVDENTV
jgi:hypothetical protein